MKKSILFLGFLLSLVCVALAASFLKTGDRIEELNFEDQFEKPLPLTKEDRLILFSREMASKDIIKAVVDEMGGDVFSRNKVAYVADISGMPRFVANMMALPKMRDYPYRMHLDRSGDLSERYPSQKGKLTLIYLNKFMVEKIEYKSSAAEVIQAIQNLHSTKAP